MSIPSITAAAATVPEVPADAEIAAFWSRIFALLIDMALLAFVGIMIGIAAFREVAALGQWGRLMGAVITLLYYGGLNSRLGGGATLGKRLMDIRVVDRGGREITLPRSLLRTAIFWTPYYLNGLVYPAIDTGNVVANRVLSATIGAVNLAIVFGGIGLILYFYVFNTCTRQSLHDLVAGTFVTKKRAAEAPVRRQIWRGHFAIAGACSVLVVTAAAVGLTYLYSSPTGALLNRLSETARVVNSRPDVETAQAQISTISTLSATHTFLVVSARLKGVPVSLDEAQNGIADAVLGSSPSIFGQQALAVTVSYGYDLGIFRWVFSSNYTATPQAWQQRIHTPVGPHQI